MARYTGPSTKIARKFGEAIFGDDKAFEKRNYPPGQHGLAKKRGKKSEYATQLMEKQKAKYTYGILERQFRNIFVEAARRKGPTGENLIKLLESRLDNAIYRMGLAASRPAARQLVAHKHITVNEETVNIPSYQLKPGDIIGLKVKSAANTALTSQFRSKNKSINWYDWNEKELKGTFIAYPEREHVPENIKEQLIVELYSK